ncbi:protein of unknown function DUF324 [Ammonifex degensii KC4]|uniref:CRISPR type III-associated protein domain-containing protein n=1 Tax=Ammonifex degensii (strain DSM 10501 / KC4) TaxID=429009 RepID=C9RCZ3_AMMDK|nr:protein of unknown function DUF324 [Ammonifex degensii KC4]
MHSRFFNEAVFELLLYPDTPLLVKAGGEGVEALDPTLPDMSFVRLRQVGGEEVPFIPGSSFRGVLRSHAERLVRSVKKEEACDPLNHKERESWNLKTACLVKDKDKGPEAYRKVCYICRLFGTTGLASRVRVGDFYPEKEPVCSTRYGVAIDRVTGAVAKGPFEMEVVTDGSFRGTITLRNFTLGQFGLLSAALLDIGEGLVPIGFGKSRGLGRVRLEVKRLAIYTLRSPEGALWGVGALCEEEVRKEFRLPPAERERLDLGAKDAAKKGIYHVLSAAGEEAVRWMEKAVPRWLEEIA